MSAAGAVVQLGRCDEDLGSPYRSFLDAVAGFDRVDGFDRADLDDPADGAGGAEPSADPWFRVLPALPEFAAWLERVRPDARDPETERYLLISGMVRLIAEAAQREPLVLVLEDLQWADPPTLQLLRRLVSETSDERLLILGTYRDELPGDHPLLRLQADHADDPDVRRIGLDGLDLVHAVQLVDAAADQSLGGPGRGLAEVLHRESSGHPFFMRHLLRHMLEDGTIDVGADGRWQIEPTARLTGVPDSVREVILARVGRLGSDADVLRAVAVSVAEVDLDELAAVMEADDAAVLSALEHGVASRLVTEVPDRPGRFRLSHPLVRRTLYDDLIASRRGFLHRRYAEVAEAQHPTVDGGAARGLAHHWSRTLRPTDRARAIPYAGLAGDWLLERLAPEAAITWYRRALDLLEAAGPSGGPSVDPASAHGKDAAMCALLVRLGDAQRQTGDPDFRQTLLDAARLADRIDDPALLVAAALANTRGFFSSSGIVDTERVDVLRLALDRIDVVDTTSRAQLLALLASELLWSDDLTERNVIAEEAISVARASGNPSTILRVLNLVYSATWTPDNLEERLERTSEAVAVARELGDEVGEFFALTFTTAAFYECARDVAGVISRMNEIADHLGQPTLKWVCRWVDAVEGTRVGDSEQAELAAEAALALGSAAGEPDVLVFYGTQLAYVRWLQGRRDELVPLLVPLADEMDRVLAFPPLLAACLLDAADTAGARELLGRELPHLGDRPANFTWLAGIIFWADIVWRLDDAEAASRLVPKLAPYARLISFNGISVQGPVADALGCLVTLLGDYDAADQYFDIADALSERLAAPFFIARALLHRADMQVLRDRPGDRSHAASHRGAALEIARRHGFAGIARDAEDASARVGD